MIRRCNHRFSPPPFPPSPPATIHFLYQVAAIAAVMVSWDLAIKDIDNIYKYASKSGAEFISCRQYDFVFCKRIEIKQICLFAERHKGLRYKSFRSQQHRKVALCKTMLETFALDLNVGLVTLTTTNRIRRCMMDALIQAFAYILLFLKRNLFTHTLAQWLVLILDKRDEGMCRCFEGDIKS
uniref:Uncharacterized protein n=1 Tax=Glossina pallidipes TaxID=7398 RepID=A0A1A9ZTZ0_GLOPL